MRYRKGHVAISDTRDVPVLLIVRNARAVTMSQLVDELFHAGLESNLRSTYWRVTRLANIGFLELKGQSKSLGEPVYAITNDGMAVLESRGYYLLSLSSESKTIVADAEVIHMVEINAIRLALRNAGILVNWKSELEIMSENLVNNGDTKDYDAMVTVRLGHREVRFALEFERTAKSAARYHEISKSIIYDDSIDLVLYLAANQGLLSLLAQELRTLGEKVVFGLSNQFKVQLLQTPVLTVGETPEFLSFDEILNYLPEAERPRSGHKTVMTM
jgi:hypothetical protein